MGRPTSSSYEFSIPPEYYPVAPSGSTCTDPLLSWTSIPYSTDQIRRSTSSAGSTTASVPSSGFAYPLDGFLPSNPSGPYCVPTALLGFSPSKLDHSLRYSRVAAIVHPPAVSLAPDVLSNAHTRKCQPRLLGFYPHERPHLLSGPHARHKREAPMGFTFLGFYRELTCFLLSEEILSCASLSEFVLAADELAYPALQSINRPATGSEICCRDSI